MTHPFDVLYADPPWRYRNVKTGGSHTSGAAQKYPTLSFEELARMPVQRLMAKDSVLFLWATAPLGGDPYALLTEWGFCCQVGTKVLTADLRWVDAERLAVGDRLVSFDDQLPGKYRHFQWGTVVSTGVEPLPCYEVVLADGTSLVCTGAHRWLMRTSGYGREEWLRWVRTDALPGHLKHHSRTRPLEIPRLVPFVEEDRSYEAGFLSAAFDSEGSIRKRKWNISFAQNENRLLSTVERMLHDKGFVFGRYHCSTNERGVKHLMFRGGREETLRFLMRFRPPRLLDNWLAHRISDSAIYKTQSVPIVEVKQVGVREVVTLQTDTGTYIANGFGAHNTYKTEWYWHKVGRKGTGYWTRGCVEKVLIGVRGKVPAWRSNLDNWIEGGWTDDDAFDGVFESKPEGHSRKPAVVRQMIEYLTPDVEVCLGCRRPTADRDCGCPAGTGMRKTQRVELFATERPEGWAAYGLALDPSHDFRDPGFWAGVCEDAA